MNIRLSRSALEDMEGIKDYYREQAVADVGINFIEAIFERIEFLAEHPDSGRIVPEFNEPHIREIIFPPFRIVYLRNTTTIQIIRVWRSERLLELPDNPAQ